MRYSQQSTKVAASKRSDEGGACTRNSLSACNHFTVCHEHGVTDASNVSPAASPDLLSVVAALQAEVMQLRLESAATIAELRQTLASLREENQVLLRRLYGNKTERLKTAETQLAFADLLSDKQALQRELNALIDEA